MTPRVRRKPGRKPLAEGQTTATFTLRLPESLHDDACRIALKQGVSVSAVLRDALLKYLPRATC